MDRRCQNQTWAPCASAMFMVCVSSNYFHPRHCSVYLPVDVWRVQGRGKIYIRVICSPPLQLQKQLEVQLQGFQKEQKYLALVGAVFSQKTIDDPYSSTIWVRLRNLFFSHKKLRLRGVKTLSNATHLIEYGCSISYFLLQVSSGTNGHSSVTAVFLFLF